jgi:hypothetical protein
VAHQIKRLYNIQNNSQYLNSPNAIREKRTLNNIKTKLYKNNAIVAKADKGNTLVILYTEEYNQRIQDFIDDNTFDSVNSDPTKSYQRELTATILECNTLIKKDSKWKFKNLNPKAPTIRGLIKIHKVDRPIRPIVNWTQAPA